VAQLGDILVRIAKMLATFDFELVVVFVRIPAQGEQSFWFNVNTCSGRT